MLVGSGTCHCRSPAGWVVDDFRFLNEIDPRFAMYRCALPELAACPCCRSVAGTPPTFQARAPDRHRCATERSCQERIRDKIGRTACRDRRRQEVYDQVVACALKKKQDR